MPIPSAIVNVRKSWNVYGKLIKIEKVKKLHYLTSMYYILQHDVNSHF